MKQRSICLLLLGTFMATSICAVTLGGQPAQKSGSPAAAAQTTPAQDPIHAEKLFRQMEDLLVKAKTLDVSFDVNMAGAIKGKLKGTLVLTAGNKSRLEIVGDLAGQPIKILVVSDGTKMTTTSTDGATTPIRDTPKEHNEAYKLFVARSGVFCAIFFLAENVQPGQKPKEFKPNEQLRVSNFRLGMIEKLGERDARMVQHDLVGRVAKEPFAVTVWLDVKTKLPLKRVVSVKQEGLAMTVSVTYSKLTLDEKVDEKQFDLPKP